MVLRDALIPLGAGLAVSIGAELLLQRLLAGLLYGISSLDPIAWLTASATLVAVGTLASLRPAWKAARPARRPAERVISGDPLN